MTTKLDTGTAAHRVFTVQFHKLEGELPESKQKDPIGPIVAEEAYRMGSEASLGFAGSEEEPTLLTMDAREGVLLLNALYGVCIVLSVSVSTLGIATIVQVFQSHRRQRGA